MRARPDSGNWASLSKEMGSSTMADAGTLTEKQAIKGTRIAKNMNVK